MVSVSSPIAEMTAAEFRRVTEVTYPGAVHGTMSALKRMRPRDRGCIVQVGSALSYRSIPLQSGLLRGEACDGSKVRVTMVQLPALNTPQFDWTKSRLPREAQPVPPIFQPAVAAKAIYWAAHNNRREVNVGLPTVAAIVANKLVPGLLDLYLGKTGYDGQQTEEADDPSKPNDLFEPLPRDHGAHGRFDDRASGSSPAFWAVKHRAALADSLLALGAALISNRKRPDTKTTQRAVTGAAALNCQQMNLHVCVRAALTACGLDFEHAVAADAFSTRALCRTGELPFRSLATPFERGRATGRP